MKKLIVAVTLLFLTVTSGTAFPEAEIKDPLDALSFINTRITAVTIDMYRYLGWFADDKDVLARAAENSIGELAAINGDLEALQVPEELAPIKDLEARMAGTLTEFYTGIEQKDPQSMGPGFMRVQKMQEELSDKLEAAYAEYGWLKDLPEDYDPVQAEMPLVDNDKDREVYIQALDLLQSKDYEAAYGILLALREKYSGTEFEPCVNLKISDCLISYGSEIRESRGTDSEAEGIGLLSQIIDSGNYSPVLFEAFYRWRTVDQYQNYGMSNMSEIPNILYNKKRWELIQLIKQYIKQHPEDAWAKGQVDYLIHLHNITRGGPMGNNNLVDWGILYSDVDPKMPET